MLTAFGMARIGRDVEVRYLTNGDAVANVSLAFTFGKKGDDGKRQTQWVDGSIFGKRAEALAPYLLKGGQIAVTLEDVHIETFKTRDGTPGTKLVGKITGVDLVSGGEKRAEAPARPTPPPVAPPRRQAPFEDAMDDDIPF